MYNIGNCKVTGDDWMATDATVGQAHIKVLLGKALVKMLQWSCSLKPGLAGRQRWKDCLAQLERDLTLFLPWKEDVPSFYFHFLRWFLWDICTSMRGRPHNLSQTCMEMKVLARDRVILFFVDGPENQCPVTFLILAETGDLYGVPALHK